MANAGGSTGGAVSASRPQGPTQQQAQQFVGAEMNAQPMPVQRTARGGIDLRFDEGNFPASQYPDQKYEDTRMAAKQAVVQGGQNFTGQPARINYSLGEDDIRYYEAKKEAQELSAYERWVASRFNFKNPADVDRFARMFPEYFERRLNVLKNISDANLRYAEICLTGAQTSDDYLYLWLVQTGKIPLINGPIWKPSEWAISSQQTTKMAMFNPLRLVSDPSHVKDGDYIPAAAGVDGNWVYPGLPTRPQGAPGSSMAMATYNAFAGKNVTEGVPGVADIASFFTGPS